MNKCLQVILFILAFILTVTIWPDAIFAHPGNTAADGCHYCRTNCAKWGEVEGERHCHGTPATVREVPPPVVTKPTFKPSPVITSRLVSSPKPRQTPATCSATSDAQCPAQCTAGNDADCCSSKLSTHRWYDNWGCYPKQLSCSANADNVCDSYCSAGNDHDCCLQKPGYTWYDNWGCYPVK